MASVGLIDSPTFWAKRFDQNFVAQASSPTRFRPIPPAATLALFRNPVIVVRTTASPVNPRWWLGCYLQPTIARVGYEPVPFGIDRRRAPLNQAELFHFPTVFDSYKIQLRFPKWIQQIRVEIWEYTEDVFSDEELRLLEIERQINALDQKVSELNARP